MHMITEEMLEKNLVTLSHDRLGHQEMADKVLMMARTMEPGSVIAIEGSWGRGKTDLLTRIAAATYGPTPPTGILPRAVWINPWRYSNTDLLTPLVRSLARRLQKGSDATTRQSRLKAMACLIAAGVGAGLKAASHSGGYGAYFEKIGDLLAGTIKSAGEHLADGEAAAAVKAAAALDPMEQMNIAFVELVNDIVGESRTRLLICIDDLDRCLPDRQIALLEAFHFLTAVSAPVIFLVAIDPTLAEKSVNTHYNIAHFDPRLYLDKIFNLRVNLPSLPGESVRGLVHAWFDTRGLDRDDNLITRRTGQNADQLARDAALALTTPSLRNPRLVERIMDRLLMLVHQNQKGEVTGSLTQLLRWMGIGERWRDIRLAVQDAEDPAARMRAVTLYYANGQPPGNEHAIVNSLPNPSQATELKMIFNEDLISNSYKNYSDIDKLLIEAGL